MLPHIRKHTDVEDHGANPHRDDVEVVEFWRRFLADQSFLEPLLAD